MNRDIRLIALSFLLWGSGEGLFFYIQPLYFEQLGAGPVQIGGLLSAVSVVSALSFLPSGWLADRLPRKWLICSGWALGVLSMLLVASARTWQWLVPALLLFYASAYCVPAINAYVAQAAGGRNLERVFTLVFAGYYAGGAISPAIGGWLAGATTMRTVYLTAAGLFALSMLAVMFISPQPVPLRTAQDRPWRTLLNKRFLRFTALVWFMFLAMCLTFPLAPNFLGDVWGWDVARIGTLGSFQALGGVVLSLLLGHLGKGRRARGLVAGQVLVWCSVLLMLLTGNFVILALAYLLRGALASCLPLVRAQASAHGSEAARGLVMGAVDTIYSVANIIAPYMAGWLYAANPAHPLMASLALIPAAALLILLGLPRPLSLA